MSPNEIPNSATNGFFPPGYCALVSSTWTYLVSLGTNICQFSSNINNAWPGVSKVQLSNMFSGGILCTQPVRSLKIYTKGLTSTSARPLQVTIYNNGVTITSFQIQFFENGGDNKKQGYAFPVIANNNNYEYEISLVGGGILDPSWIIVFSDPVIGNRWTPDTIQLTVKGQNCNKRFVTSQHDRRWLWADSRDFLFASAWGRGACSSQELPDMPIIQCTSPAPVIPKLSCASLCSSTCNNGYCDCGLQQCVCSPGFIGQSCEIDLCAAARCGPHGTCTATYLGGELQVSQKACICEEGWSGPSCDFNPCAGQTCSGNGVCKAVGDTGWECKCDIEFSGLECQNSCVGYGCQTNSYPFGCMSGSSKQALYCLKGKMAV